MGRGIRRLVTLYDSLEDILEEADRQARGDNDIVDNEFIDDDTYDKEHE